MKCSLKFYYGIHKNFVKKTHCAIIFRNEMIIFRAKTTKREEVNTAYSLTSDELFAAENFFIAVEKVIEQGV